MCDCLRDRDFLCGLEPHLVKVPELELPPKVLRILTRNYGWMLLETHMAAGYPPAYSASFLVCARNQLLFYPLALCSSLSTLLSTPCVTPVHTLGRALQTEAEPYDTSGSW